jgi:hypothetical protein
MMADGRTPHATMVHLRTVPTTFHARVIAARLGAEGIPTQLRGNVGGFYPIGDVSVWVARVDAEDASELLLADEIESAFDTHRDDEEPRPPGRRLLGLTPQQLTAAIVLISIGVSAGFARLNLF